jgi:hypothetical protein
MAQQLNPQPQNVVGQTCDNVTQLFTTWEDVARRDKDLDHVEGSQTDLNTAKEGETTEVLDNFDWLENSEFFL